MDQRDVDVELVGVTKRYGDLTAVAGVSLAVHRGEFFSILGPSGCGKTTILRMIAGFIEPSEGEILIAGKPTRGVAPNRRPTSLIFQHLALFPLMNVYDNIAFGLRMRGVSEGEISGRVASQLELINLSGYGPKRVDQLSGGERQRVAIARSLIIAPTVLLLDEPLGALDLKLREHMKEELKAIQHRVGTTFIYITHDQGEALAMSDRVAVMSRGRIEQIGTPSEIYEQPQTRFVAYFVGENNAIAGRTAREDAGRVVVDTPEGRLVSRNPQVMEAGRSGLIFIRPEKLQCTAGDDRGSGPNALRGTLEEIFYEGPMVRMRVRLHTGRQVAVVIPNLGRTVLPAVGDAVVVTFSADDAYLLPDGGA
ncbi:MAG: ABC transporter ATP-binding protein [Armatimonadetes bacterium]|nr:ABC transporter ATP-binding protein [Armatimonadota bacterium]